MPKLKKHADKVADVQPDVLTDDKKDIEETH